MRALLVAVIATLVATVAIAGSAPSAAAMRTVRVRLVNGRAVLSTTRIQPGSIRFVVTNAGPKPARFAVGSSRTALIRPGGRAQLTVAFPAAGRYGYRVVGGKAGVLTVTAPPAFSLVPVGTFDSPVLVTSPPGDTHRIFVVQQTGVIRELLDGQLLATPFLDISKLVLNDDENGLLSMVFAPDYASSGRFYVYYNDHDGNVHLVEYRRSANNPDVADPSTARQVLFIAKPYANHNAGMMQFGADGDLYVAVGDGDSGVKHKPGAFAQTLNDLLGNILRIDPLHGDPYAIPAGNPYSSVAGARPELWDVGLRNPWRFWIDAPTGDLYIGDVQLGGPEEIDYVAGNHGGQDFGWPCYQGTVRFDPSASCPNAVAPIVSYPHADGACAAIGGVTVHDPALPTLAGYYLYGDLCTGEIKTFHVVDGKAVNQHPLHLTVPGLDSFGVDAAGHVYAISVNGPVYRLAAQS